MEAMVIRSTMVSACPSRKSVSASRAGGGVAQGLSAIAEEEEATAERPKRRPASSRTPADS